MSLDAFFAAVVRALDEAGIPFMLTGSLAAALYDVPRATKDIDVVIEPSADRMDRLVDALAVCGFYVSPEAAREALARSGQFNAIDPESGWKADFIVRKARPFSASEFGRRRRTQAFGVEIDLATIEDLIIAKRRRGRIRVHERRRELPTATATCSGALRYVPLAGARVDGAGVPERRVERPELGGAGMGGNRTTARVRARVLE